MAMRRLSEAALMERLFSTGLAVRSFEMEGDNGAAPGDMGAFGSDVAGVSSVYNMLPSSASSQIFLCHEICLFGY